MGSRLQGRYLAASALLLAALPLEASRTTTPPAPSINSSAIFRASVVRTTSSLLESLRNDTAQHPQDYVVFETQIAAQRFIAAHLDARRETDRTMIGRGILGYWQGRTIAVVPSLATSNHPQTSR